MFCLMKCSKKVLAAVAALLCCGGMLAAIWQTKEVLGSAYEDLYPDMYVNTGSQPDNKALPFPAPSGLSLPPDPELFFQFPR